MQEQDIISIAYLEEPTRFADLINGFVYHGQELIRVEDIREINRSMARISRKDKHSNKLHAQVITADIVREVTHNMQVSIVALENQTDIHYAMPVRVMNFEGVHYHKQWRATSLGHRQKKDLSEAEFLSGFSKEDKLIPIITLVVYFGKEPWDGPKSLCEMMNLDNYPLEVKDLIVDYPIHLFEVRNYKNLEHFHTDLQHVFGFLQYETDKKELKKYVNEHKEVFENLREDAYDMISVMSHSRRLEINKKEYTTKEGGCDMCQAIEEMIEDGRRDGRIEIAIKMYHDGKLTIREACEYLEITEEEFVGEEKKYTK